MGNRIINEDKFISWQSLNYDIQLSRERGIIEKNFDENTKGVPAYEERRIIRTHKRKI